MKTTVVTLSRKVVPFTTTFSLKNYEYERLSWQPTIAYLAETERKKSTGWMKCSCKISLV